MSHYEKIINKSNMQSYEEYNKLAQMSLEKYGKDISI